MKRHTLTAFALIGFASVTSAFGDCEYYTNQKDPDGCNNQTSGTCSWDAELSQCVPMNAPAEGYQPWVPEDQRQGD